MHPAQTTPGQGAEQGGVLLRPDRVPQCHDHSLPNGRSALLSLPTELLYEIAFQLRWLPLPPAPQDNNDFALSSARTRFNTHRFSLCSFLQTCRAISSACKSVLYEAVEVCMKDPDNGEHLSCGGSLPLLLRTLESRPELAASVKAIALNLDASSHEWDEGSPSREAALRLFELCRNVHTFYTDTLLTQFLEEADIRGLQALATSFVGGLLQPEMASYLGNLENLVLEEPYFNYPEVFTKLPLPKLKHLSLVRCLQPASEVLNYALTLPAESLEDLFIQQVDRTRRSWWFQTFQSTGFQSFQPKATQFPRESLYGRNLKRLTLCGKGMISSIQHNPVDIWEHLPSLKTLILARDDADILLATLWEIPAQVNTLILADLVLLPVMADALTPLSHAVEVTLWVAGGSWGSDVLIFHDRTIPTTEVKEKHPCSPPTTKCEIVVYSRTPKLAWAPSPLRPMRTWG